MIVARAPSLQEPAPSSAALPAPSAINSALGPLGGGDINKIHLDMFFDRSLVPRSPPFPSVASVRNTSTSATAEAAATAPTTTAAATINELVVSSHAEHDHQYDRHTDASFSSIVDSAPSHHFDTFEQVTHLQAWGGFSRKQAKALMETLQHLIRMSVSQQRDTLLASSQLENETYLISAAVAEFRREVQLLRRNDSALLQSELTALAREVDSLEQRLNEDLGSMRDELELTMNDYRSDVREEQKIAEHQIQGINNRLTIMLGDTTTEIESLKWKVIWRGLVGGVMAALGISAVGYALSIIRLRSMDRAYREKKKAEESDLSFADMEIS